MKVKVELVVEIDDDKIEQLGYEDAYDFLDDCDFDVRDSEGNYIETEVRDYNEIEDCD